MVRQDKTRQHNTIERRREGVEEEGGKPGTKSKKEESEPLVVFLGFHTDLDQESNQFGDTL
jgi:hypothetical protein